MTRYRVRCGVCGDGPDFTDPTDPKCAGCMLHADDCTCSPERPSIEDEWYEQDSGGGDGSAKGADSTPVQAATSLPRPSPSPTPAEALDRERLARAIEIEDDRLPFLDAGIESTATPRAVAEQIADRYARLSRRT